MDVELKCARGAFDEAYAAELQAVFIPSSPTAEPAVLRGEPVPLSTCHRISWGLEVQDAAMKLGDGVKCKGIMFAVTQRSQSLMRDRGLVGYCVCTSSQMSAAGSSFDMPLLGRSHALLPESTISIRIRAPVDGPANWSDPASEASGRADEAAVMPVGMDMPDSNASDRCDQGSESDASAECGSELADECVSVEVLDVQERLLDGLLAGNGGRICSRILRESRLELNLEYGSARRTLECRRSHACFVPESEVFPFTTNERLKLVPDTSFHKHASVHTYFFLYACRRTGGTNGQPPSTACGRKRHDSLAPHAAAQQGPWCRRA